MGMATCDLETTPHPTVTARRTGLYLSSSNRFPDGNPDDVAQELVVAAHRRNDDEFSFVYSTYGTPE